MEITISLFFILLSLAFICELIDSSLGMGYGTILSPILLILGFDPLVAVPAVLLSQACGGLAASIFHHKYKNVSFLVGSKDFKIASIIVVFGVVAAVAAALIAIKIPKIVLKTYIGVLVLVMGFIILFNYKFNFSWKKIVAIGMLSAFNKGISGGGFGPVVTAGQILSGQKHKPAIGVTTLAEVPICIVSFLTYLIGRIALEVKEPIIHISFKDFLINISSSKMFNVDLWCALILGSILVSPIGPFLTKKLNERYLHVILGIFIISLGAWTIIEVYLK